MTIDEFIQKVIKRGFENGLTAEQMLANPQAAAKAYVESEIKMNQDIANKLIAEGYNKK